MRQENNVLNRGYGSITGGLWPTCERLTKR